MCISDWGSDVCLADLRTRGWVQNAPRSNWGGGRLCLKRLTAAVLGLPACALLVALRLGILLGLLVKEFAEPTSWDSAGHVLVPQAHHCAAPRVRGVW